MIGRQAGVVTSPYGRPKHVSRKTTKTPMFIQLIVAAAVLQTGYPEHAICRRSPVPRKNSLRRDIIILETDSSDFLAGLM